MKPLVYTTLVYSVETKLGLHCLYKSPALGCRMTLLDTMGLERMRNSSTSSGGGSTGPRYVLTVRVRSVTMVENG